MSKGAESKADEGRIEERIKKMRGGEEKEDSGSRREPPFLW